MRRDAVVIALVLSLAGCATIRADQMPPAWPRLSSSLSSGYVGVSRSRDTRSRSASASDTIGGTPSTPSGTPGPERARATSQDRAWQPDVMDAIDPSAHAAGSRWTQAVERFWPSTAMPATRRAFCRPPSHQGPLCSWATIRGHGRQLHRPCRRAPAAQHVRPAGGSRSAGAARTRRSQPARPTLADLAWPSGSVDGPRRAKH